MQVNGLQANLMVSKLSTIGVIAAVLVKESAVAVEAALSRRYSSILAKESSMIVQEDEFISKETQWHKSRIWGKCKRIYQVK